MKKHTLTVQPRTVFGRHVKNLRKQGIVPASVYGKNVKSVSLSVKLDDAVKVIQEAGESGLVELSVGKDKKPVLIHAIQRDPVSGVPLHIEFFQVDLKQKVHANVPVEFTGESPTVSQKQGVLLTILDEIEVEALPRDLPEKITVDTSGLTSVESEIRVRDLALPSGVTVVTDGGLTVVKVGALVTKEVEEEAKAEAAAAAAAAAEAPAAEAAAAPPEVEEQEKPEEEEKP